MRYVIPFGSGNAGGTPTFTAFTNAADWSEIVPQPALTVVDAAGRSYFDVAWDALSATSVSWVATVGGTELAGVINSDGTTANGSAVAVASATNLSGYSTVGVIVARALVQAGLLNLSRSQIATFDPFSSTDQYANQALELFDQLGLELVSEVSAHLQRVFTITTAGSVTSYALPSDYLEMVEETLWDNSSQMQMEGPITPQNERAQVAWSAAATVRLPFRVAGNRLTFPIAPGDGLSLSGLYISRNWIQTAGASSPDSDHVTAATDYVLFDPTLMVLGLKFKVLQAKKMDIAVELAEYEKRLEWVKATVGGMRDLNLGGGDTGFRFIDETNVPDGGWGI